jgi:hypothetical protein
MGEFEQWNNASACKIKLIEGSSEKGNRKYFKTNK